MNKSEKIGMIHIDNCPENYRSWTVSDSSESNISGDIIKKFEPHINGKIVEKKICTLLSIEDINNEKQEMNIRCYSIEWENEKYQHYIYIQKYKIDNFIKKEKLERLLKT